MFSTLCMVFVTGSNILGVNFTLFITSVTDLLRLSYGTLVNCYAILLRQWDLKADQTCSIGLSGLEYGGRNSNVTCRLIRNLFVACDLWELWLSATITISLCGASVKWRNYSRNAYVLSEFVLSVVMWINSPLLPPMIP